LNEVGSGDGTSGQGVNSATTALPGGGDQFNHAPGDKAHNLGIIRTIVAEAHRARVDLLVFPEMCITGYWHVRKLKHEAIQALAEPVPSGPGTRELLELSAATGMTIGAGLIECAS
jgi:predicted amidohydrolase